MRTTKMILSVVLALASACGDVAPVDLATVSAAEQRVALRPGDVHRYDFAWTVRSESSSGTLGDIPVQGDVGLRGELAVRVYEERDGAVLVGVRFTRLDEHRLAVLGQDVLPEPDLLLRDEALVLLPRDARPREVYFDPAVTPVFRQLMSGVLAHVDLSVPPPSADAWRELGPTGNGLAELSYSRGEADTITRTVGPYRRVDALSGAPADAPWIVEGQGTIALGDDALVESIELSETLVLHGRETPMEFGNETKFSLRRAGIDRSEAKEPTPAPDLATWMPLDLFEAPPLDEAERQLARMFAEGLTSGDLAITVHTAGLGLRPEAGFLPRARGLLRGWPEAALELPPLWAEAPDQRTREFILDLLVSADTPQSQAVILAVLGEQSDAGDAELPTMLQHLSLLRAPTPEIGVFVLETHADAQARGDDRLRRASLYPMGALANTLTTRHPELAERMIATVRGELDAATTADSVQAALAGLGNAGRDEDVPRVLGFRAHPDRGVRAQVASSVRFSTDPRATDALFELLSDRERYVAGSALDVIDFYRPDDDTLQRLAATVVGGVVNPELEGPLVSVLAKRGLDDELSREAMAILRERSTDARTRLRIRRILGLEA